MAKSCKHKDCRYYNEKTANTFSCNYALYEGKTKLSQLKPGEKYDVSNCQFYSSAPEREYLQASATKITIGCTLQ